MVKEIKPGMMKHCIIANITREPHIENGVIRYGTKVYPGGRKVYISRHLHKDEVVVMGLSRFKSHYVEGWVPLNLLTNIRYSRVFTLSVLRRMINYSEGYDMWWSYKKEDEEGAKEFVKMIKQIQMGNMDAWEKYAYDERRFKC